MNFPDLKQWPAWLLLFGLGAILIILGASREITISGNTLRLASPLNYIPIIIGVGFVVIGVIDIKRKDSKNNSKALPIESVSIDVIDVPDSGNKRARMRGKVSPAVGGIRIWILREHLSGSPGKFHVGANAALTDKNGEWQQFTNLWSNGRFRLHAFVVDSDSELLFRYYRRAFEEARQIYRKEVDSNAKSFPGWPTLDSLPSNYVSSHSEIVL